MDQELLSANQRIDDMSFKDLTARATAALKLKPAASVKTPAKEGKTNPAGKEAPAKPKAS